SQAIGADLTVAQSMRVLFIGQLIGLVSMVPGGLGTADGAWIIQLARAGVPSGAAAALVMLFRICFYVVPWLISLLAIIVVAVLLRTGRHATRPVVAVALGMVLGGALGNLIDRAVREGDGFLGGGVVDFVDLQWWPVFNLADSAIVVGAALLFGAQWRDAGAPAATADRDADPGPPPDGPGAGSGDDADR
nr:hypothetical protein [Thermoanaerobacterales bacterium]